MYNKLLNNNLVFATLLFYIVLSTFIQSPVLSQTFTKSPVKIIQDGNTLSSPVSGGLISPIIQQADLDADGLSEIIVFDKIGGVFNVYNWDEAKQTYIYWVNPPVDFPKVENWALIRDYDNDGVIDIFFCPNEGAFGFGVYKGSTNLGRLQFHRLNLNQGLFNVLYTPGSNGPINLYCSNIDIPFIYDIDNDGGLDIFTYETGGTYLELYLNKSVEKGYGTDSLIYLKEDMCYGKFSEDGFSDIKLGPGPNQCASSFDEPSVETRHAGSTTLLKDINHDGLMDILLGDASFNNINYLINTESNVKSYITDHVHMFPSNNPVDLGPFPAAYSLEYSPDRLDYLVFSSNSGTLIDESQLIWLYKYDADSSNDAYQLVQKDFLMEESIDLGLDFNPAFIDIDSDGKQDMIAGNKFKIIDGNNYKSGLTYFRNISEGGEIGFEVMDNDFLGLNANDFSIHGYKPTFGDLDNDGFIDLLIGIESGYLIHYESTSKSPSPLNFIKQSDRYFDLRVPSKAAPHIYDITNDGLNDILVGDKNGNFALFVNQGSQSSPQFSAVFNQAPNKYPYGGITVKEQFETEGVSTAQIFDFNGSPHLLSGSKTGKLRLYSGIEAGVDALLTEVQFGTDVYSGRQNSPVLVDLNNDQAYELINGNIRGGFNLFGTNIKTDGSLNTGIYEQELDLATSPNPLKIGDNLFFRLKDANINLIKLYNLNGLLVQSIVVDQNQNFFKTDQNLLPGVYILSLVTETGLKVTQKILLQ